MEMEEKIKKWKQEYEEIFAINIMNEIYYYRVINREEYKNIFYKNLDPASFQEEISKVGVLYPQNIDFEKAGGLAESLSTLILDCSYLNEGQAKELLNEYRKEMLVFDNQADCLIHEAFPEYKIEDIEKFTIKKTLHLLSRAEYILREFRGVPIAHVGMDEETEIQMNEIINEVINKEYEKEYKKESIKEKIENEIIEKELEKKEDLSLSYPELNWFKAYDDLTGEYE